MGGEFAGNMEIIAKYRINYVLLRHYSGHYD